MKECDRRRDIEEGLCFLFFIYLFFLLPCSFQAFCRRPRALFNLKRRSSTDCNKEGGRWNGESGIKERGERRRVEGEKERERGREWGSVAAAVRLNDVFQEEQSSLSNRRLRNELAYLLGSTRRCRATAFHIPR